MLIIMTKTITKITYLYNDYIGWTVYSSATSLEFFL